jgi:hypothetical protein
MNAKDKQIFDLPKIILVLGMHRSGTSLAAQLIAKWGAYMGKELMPANKYNEYGYWEYNPLVDFHEKLLKKTNNKWYAPSWEIDAKKLLNEFGDEARQLVRDMDEGGDIWCWKDPRMPLFLDFWKEILAGREIVYILSSRQPQNIAGSLFFRDNMPASIALALWEYTTSRIFQTLSMETNYKFFDYDNIVLKPDIYCRDLLDYLNESCHTIKSREIYEVMVQSVKKNLNHTKPDMILSLRPNHKKLRDIIEEETIPADFIMSEDQLYNLKEIFSLYRKLDLRNQHFHFAQLFFKSENIQYDEFNSIVTEVTEGSEKIIFKFKSAQPVNNFRFDPLNDYVRVRIIAIQLQENGELLEVPFTLSSNALTIENEIYLFDTKDPQIFIEFEKDTSLEFDEIIVQLKYLSIGSETFELISSFKEDLIKTQREGIYKLSQEYESTLINNEHLVNRIRIEEAKNLYFQNLVIDLDLSNKALEQQNHQKNEINRILEIKLIELQNKCDDLTYQLKQTKQELDNLKAAPGIRYFYRIMLSIKPYLPAERVSRIFRRLKYLQSYYSLKHSDLMDEASYLKNNPDVSEKEMSAVKHYLLFGGFEGRNPSENFDSAFYLEQNPDVKLNGVNPLVHYMLYGKKEGRSTQ